MAIGYPKLRYATWLMGTALPRPDESCFSSENRAKRLLDQGDLDKAESVYLELMESNTPRAEWCYELGAIRYQKKDYRGAAAAMLQSLGLDVHQPQCHFLLGACSRALSDRRIEEDHLSLLVNGLLLARPPGISHSKTVTGDQKKPVSAEGGGVNVGYVRVPAGDAKRNDWDAFVAHVLLFRGSRREAIARYEQSFSRNPDDGFAVRMLSEALLALDSKSRSRLMAGHQAFLEGRYTDAIRGFEEAALQGELYELGYIRWVAALEQKKEYTAAAQVCCSGLERFPFLVELHRSHVRSLLANSQTEEAIEALIAAANLVGDRWFMFYERSLALPVLYRNEAEMLGFRSRYGEGLRELLAVSSEKDELTREFFRERESPWYYLAYQAFDVVELQKQHGAFLSVMMRESLPCADLVATTCSGRLRARMKVAYVTLAGSEIEALFLGWVSGHDTTRFEVFTYQIGTEKDLLGGEFRRHSEHFCALERDIGLAAGKVIEDGIDVLVYLHVGMSYFMTQLAALRLAPVQCAAWGHPVTTGLPTIDYYISNELMEPECGQQHYSESLVRLPGIGVSLPPFFQPPVRETCETYGFEPGAIAYLAIQYEAKYLPQYDFVFPAIAGAVPEARFIFMECNSQGCTRILKSRLSAAFREAGLDSKEFVRFQPKLGYYDWLDFLRAGDVFLDTFGWSGGLSTLDAVCCGVPVVTCPGEFMRGRQSAGILRKMGVQETIATDVDEYIEIAVKLGLYEGWRHAIRGKMGTRCNRLFENQECVVALEEFFLNI